MIFEKLVHDLLIIINSNIISILIIIRIRLLRDRGFQPHQPQVVFSNWQTKARGISRIHDKQIGYILPRICSVINHPPMTSKFIRTIKVAHKVQLSVSLIFLLHFLPSMNYYCRLMPNGIHLFHLLQKQNAELLMMTSFLYLPSTRSSVRSNQK